MTIDVSTPAARQAVLNGPTAGRLAAIEDAFTRMFELETELSVKAAQADALVFANKRVKELEALARDLANQANILTSALPLLIGFGGGTLVAYWTTDWVPFATGFALATTLALTFLHLEARRKYHSKENHA